MAKTETFLPEGTTEFLRRRTSELGAVGLLVVALLISVSLASYSALDPSFNNATALPAENWLGIPGAYLADASYQGVGLGTFALIGILIAWGWRLISHQGLTWPWLRIASLPVSIIAVSIFAGGITAPLRWPIESGLGGIIGQSIYSAVIELGHGIRLGENPWGYGIGLGLVAGALVFFSAGLSGREWRGVARTGGRGIRAGYLGIVMCGRIGKGLAEKIPSRDKAPRDLLEEPRIHADEPAIARTEGPIEPNIVTGPYSPTTPQSEAIPTPAPEPSPISRIAKRKPKLKIGKRAAAEAQPALNLGGAGFELPALALLQEAEKSRIASRVNEDALEQNARMLEAVLDDFGVHGEITQVFPGPVVTLYELEPARGTKTSRVIGLADDIARSMSAVSVRVAVVPGKNAIGIELPNTRIETVYLRELLSSKDYEDKSAQLLLALGKDIGGAPVIAELARMPHLLVAGTTGSGKSVAINSMILSIVYRLRPDQCRMIMIDPKMLELSVYDNIPHLLTPVVTEPGKAVVALKWAVREMESRYRDMSNLSVRNIVGYNERLERARKSGEGLKRTVQTGFDQESGQPVIEDQPLDLKPMPHIVIVVDEMADLMLLAGKDIESSVQRLSQMARAAGIHLIMATQRPSVDVITGTIKANFPTRISFQVTSKIDSRTILGEPGAEQLLGSGDMLYMQSGGRVRRVHGPFVSEQEVENVVAHLRAQGVPDYIHQVTEEPEAASAQPAAEEDAASNQLFDEAVELICREGKASTSFIQRHLRIGYNRAARIIERMESEGIISPANHVGKREVLARRIDDDG
jgi:S-DNA-T family DNA segregation ATPase FtsK/SpoIIIE